MDYREFAVLNGKYKLATELTDFRMSLWICGFGILETETNQEILPMIHYFNLDKKEDFGDFLRIQFRIYPFGLKNYIVDFYPDKQKYFYENQWFEIAEFESNFNTEEEQLIRLENEKNK